MSLPGVSLRPALPMPIGNVFLPENLLPDVTPKIPPREIFLPTPLPTPGKSGKLPGSSNGGGLPGLGGEVPVAVEITPEVRPAGANDYTQMGVIMFSLMALMLLR